MAVRLEFDESFFPIVTIVFPHDGSSDEDVDHMIQAFERIQNRGARYSVILDGGGIAAIPDARQRKRIVEWEKVRADVIGRLNVGTGIVIDSAMVRGALTATRWLSKATAPEKVFDNPGDAGLWCIAQLDAASVPVPPPTRRLVEALVAGGPRALRLGVGKDLVPKRSEPPRA